MARETAGSGGKSNRPGTPQGGVISPLLANLYMNRFLKFWRVKECGKSFRAHVVNYADDCAPRRREEEALDVNTADSKQPCCTRDEGWPPRTRIAGSGSKPPQAAPAQRLG